MNLESIEWSHLVEVRRLRGGGMASLYLMDRTSVSGFRKKVVLKRIHERWMSDPLTRTLFINEAQTHANFDHPHIVQLFDFGSEKDVLWMALEYVDGGDLYSLSSFLGVRGREKRSMIALQVLNEMASALSQVHQQVIHEDISPSNILYGKAGFFKLCDFGVARIKDSKEPNQRDAGLGKFRYMAPEKICNSATDERSDIFSLGVSIAEFYAGQKLYGDLLPDDLLRLIRQGGYFKHIVALDLPPALREIVYRAVQPSANDRFQSANELLRTVILAQARMTQDFGAYTLEMALRPNEPNFISDGGFSSFGRPQVPSKPSNSLNIKSRQPSRNWAKVISIILSFPILWIVPFLSGLQSRSSQRSRDPFKPGTSEGGTV